MSEEKTLDLDIKLKPVLRFKWGNEEGFDNFRKGYEKGFEEAQEIIIREVKQRIQEVVQGLLREIEKQEEKTTNILADMLSGKIKEKAVNRGALYGKNEVLSWVKNLIKKYFPDEVKR